MLIGAIIIKLIYHKFLKQHIMTTKLKATVTEQTPKGIHLEISKENFETFCDAAGLYRKEFIKILNIAEKDHQKGRVTKRNSLSELIEKK